MNNHSLDHGLTKAIMPNKAAIYVRWSTDEQTDGNTLSIQLGACKHYLNSQGWQVNEDLVYIDEGCSGGNLDRPAMKKLRKDVLRKTEAAASVLLLFLDI
ncbi:MAG: recombinase family protein [Ignavibacteriaceae bacterium]|nr:recombinase family protein [Ignavibacteriaceae bacterium]